MLQLEDDVCPVGDQLLGELYHMSKQGLPVLVASLPPDIRAMLALFCYRRTHLHEIGLAIAVNCAEDDLIRSGGTLGAALFARSREALPSVAVIPHYSARRTITLATRIGVA